MAITTTGSTVLGLINGLTTHLPMTQLAGSVASLSEILTVVGTPNGVVTSPVSSGVAYDIVGRELYFATTAGGSTWLHLISGT